MNRLNLNIWIDLLLFLSGVVMSVSGWAIRLFHPMRGAAAQESLLTYPFLGLSRHAWRDLHLWSGILFLLLLVLHIWFHRELLSAHFKRAIPQRPLRLLLYGVLLILALLALLPWSYAWA